MVLGSSSRFDLVRFWSAMAAYIVLVLVQSYLYDHGLVPPEWRAVVALVPVLPLCFVVYAVVVNLRSLDELQRKIQFEAMSIAFGITSVASIAYGFLEIGAGAPPINLVWVWAVLGFCWLCSYFVVRRRYR